eukprot:14466007-Ditylum_brightwellii.AAC.1
MDKEKFVQKNIIFEVSKKVSAPNWKVTNCLFKYIEDDALVIVEKISKKDIFILLGKSSPNIPDSVRESTTNRDGVE